MKYLVNRETKEHKVHPGFGLYGPHGWDIVEADAEGWIKWDGSKECPVADGSTVDVWTAPTVDFLQGLPYYANKNPDKVIWQCVARYRPILEPTTKESLTVEQAMDAAGAHYAKQWNADTEEAMDKAIEGAMDEYDLSQLLINLKSAHEAAQMIPDLLAQLRQVLEPMGYDVVARSPFVEPEQAAKSAECDSIICDWEPCNPACASDLGGYKSKSCTCKAAVESMAAQIAKQT
jgi:hypothetical protein